MRVDDWPQVSQWLHLMMLMLKLKLLDGQADGKAKVGAEKE